ncbi:hypothetical protein BLX88_07140, partial [Bacillus obstructivus]
MVVVGLEGGGRQRPRRVRAREAERRLSLVPGDPQAGGLGGERGEPVRLMAPQMADPRQAGGPGGQQGERGRGGGELGRVRDL